MAYILEGRTRSFISERLLKLDGEPFTLSGGYDLYRAIYDGDYPFLLLKNARQTGKSTTIANFIAVDSTVLPHHKSLYISPSEGQTTRFSHLKLDKTIKSSPQVRQMFHKGGINNVFLMTTGNGSEIILSYANADPDRVRGNTSDTNFYDEIQDMNLLEVTTVAGACLDASPDPRVVMSGTPKTMENGLEEYWQRSSMTEPLIKCEGCNCYNKPSIDNIGKFGFICKRCGKLLDVSNCVWKDYNDRYLYKGFHIPQIILPIHANRAKKWEILLDKFETWPRNRFMNEVMAESDSVGTRLLNRSDLEELTMDYSMSRTPTKEMMKDVELVVAGVDWSGGGKEGVSRTVVHIWGVIPNLRIKTLYSKVYPVEDPTISLDDIVQVLKNYEVKFVMGDRGEGALANGMLMQHLGRHRVGQFFYGSHKQPIRFDDQSGVYQLDKTTVIDNYFKFLKDGGATFPNSVDSKIGFDDIMNEFSEVTKVGKKIWSHGPSSPDDSLHAQIGGWIAYKILKRDMGFF